MTLFCSPSLSPSSDPVQCHRFGRLQRSSLRRFLTHGVGRRSIQRRFTLFLLVMLGLCVVAVESGVRHAAAQSTCAS